MPAVQFFGKEQVMRAAEQLKCPAWAVFWEGNKLFTKYEGTDIHGSIAMLDSVLDALVQSTSAAIYTIKFFEQPDKGKLKLNEKSICDGGSFNFKLINPDQRLDMLAGYAVQYGGGGQTGELLKKIDALEKKILEREEAAEDTHEETIGAVFLDMLKNPDKISQLINAGRFLMGLPVQPMPAMGAIPGVAPGRHCEGTEANENLYDRIAGAIDTLEKKDPGLADHLEKLARMGPDQLKGIVSLLDTMP